MYFQHNKINQELGYILDIYSITGVLVRRIQNIYEGGGFRIGPISWDGKDDNGSKVSAGMYIANLVVNAEDGGYSSNSIRIILLPE